MFGLNKKSKSQVKEGGHYKKDKKEKLSFTAPASSDSGNVKKAVPDLICKSYVDGCLVLGCVHDILHSELIVSLPGIGNYGYIKINNISNSYTEYLKNGSEAASLHDMYQKGNFLRCKVLNYSNNRLYLTIEPNQVNANLTYQHLENNMIISGAVKTKEDHGYSIDLGIEELTGFLKVKSNIKLSIGQCCLFKLKDKSSTRAISLTLCNSDEKENSFFYETQNKYKFDSYLPGAQITCTVDKISRTGLQVNVSTQLFAYVHINHLPLSLNYLKRTKKDDRRGKSNEENLVQSAHLSLPYENSDRIKGTIIFINPYSKVIYLSLLPHLLDSNKVPKITRLFLSSSEKGEKPFKLGYIVESAEVVMHTFKGVYVEFKLNSKMVAGFVPKRQLFDRKAKTDKDEDDDEDDEDDGDFDEKNPKKNKRNNDAANMTREDLEKAVPLHSHVRARVYDFNLIEDIILLSLRPSVLNEEILTYEELSVGQVVDATVKRVNAVNGSVLVRLSAFVSALIPKLHTSDVPFSDTLIARKLKPGATLKCRIIQLNASEKKCVLTAKKTLIKSKLPLIESFETVQRGQETYGTVVSIQKYGLILAFLNDLKGLLPREQISETMKEHKKRTADDGTEQDLKELFYLGQLIKCKVLDINPSRQTLKLSLIMKNDDKETDENSASTPKVNKNELKKKQLANSNKKTTSAPFSTGTLSVGDVIDSARIEHVNETNGFFKLRLPDNSSGIIYKNHLSDMDCLNDALFATFKGLQTIPQSLMVTQCPQPSLAGGMLANNQKMSYYMTCKTSLIDFYTQQKANNEAISQSFDDLKSISPSSNKWLNGWIRKILPNGVLVELPYNLVGFSSNSEIKYANELKPEKDITIGQSVILRVNRLYDEKQQFVTSLHTRHDLMQIHEADCEFMVQLFRSTLKSCHQILSNQVAPISENNTNFYQAVSNTIKLGAVCQVIVKSFDEAATKRVELIFKDELTVKKTADKCVLQGFAFAYSGCDEDTFEPGTTLQALVLAIDPLTKSVCLAIDPKAIQTYRKNFDSAFSSNITCKQGQFVKAEILYVSQWFCIVGLRAHALGKLAFMPLFKNDFTQLNNFVNTNKDVDLEIKRKQILAVSSNFVNEASFENVTLASTSASTNKDDRHFVYYSIGQIGKVEIKSAPNDELGDYLIVVHDIAHLKGTRKLLIRQLSSLHLNNESNTSNGLKRKSAQDEEETPEVVRKKVLLDADNKKSKRKQTKELTLSSTPTKKVDNDNRDSIEIVTAVKRVRKTSLSLADIVPATEKTTSNGDSSSATDMVFPWEVTDFDQFYDLINKSNGGQENGYLNGIEEEKLQTAEVSNKKVLAAKEKKNYLTDRNIYELEEKLNDPTRQPENADDYDRLLATSPNSSLIWIKYMVFYLQMAEIDKARSIAQQALKTISYKDEKDRLNLWVALLNLENMYGTTHSMEDTFNRATQNCDSLKVHTHMAEIYARSDKKQDAESVYMKMIRKFSKNQDVWIKYAVFHYKNTDSELARKLMLKSLSSLDKKDHVDMVNKFSQLEFKYGDVERAKTMYDSLLFTYPNRTDLWSVYIDMLVKYKKFDDARHIFNRIVQLGLPAKRMKFIFKKFLDFEKLYGTEDQVALVKEMAVKYVENNSIKSADKNKSAPRELNTIESNLKKNLNI